MRSVPCLFHSALAVTWLLFAPAAGAETVIFAGRWGDPFARSGYYNAEFFPLPPFRSAGDGVAAGYADRWIDGIYYGKRAVRWDASGSPPVELGLINGRGLGSVALAVNAAGTAVGRAELYDAGGNYQGDRAVRWDASGTAATELGILSTDSSGRANSVAFGVNNAGTAVGLARKYESGSDKGDRAVRWNASGTAATELGNLGTTSSGVTSNYARAVNAAGTAVGTASKYDAGISKGERAVRWHASGTAATELGNLGTDSNGATHTEVNAINTAGTSVGWALKSSNIDKRAVRWDASGTAATELGNLGTSSGGATTAYAYDINDAGTAVGIGTKYDAAGINKGQRAVRWDAAGTAAFELGLLGTDTYGEQNSYVGSINAAGIAVGNASFHQSNGAFDQRAVAWGPDGVAIDLNDLIDLTTQLDSTSGWLRLITAHGISDTNWVTGMGYFDPGPGYDYSIRPFLLDISSVVPEPNGLVFVAVAFPALLRRRRGRD